MPYDPFGAGALPLHYAQSQGSAGFSNITSTLDLSGLDRTMAALRSLTNLNATPLMKTWMDIMEADNRRGVLQGLDKDGAPMVAVSYRPIPPGPLKTTKAQRGGRRANARAGGFTGGVGGNLTSYEYRLLGGPPLAPRDQFSRVITNFKTDYAELRPGYWQATFWWDDVVNAQGEPFLRYHFDGAILKGGGRLPRRDLRGIRPDGRRQIMDALQNWARLAVREAFASR
jgi:hypothetical protein